MRILSTPPITHSRCAGLSFLRGNTARQGVPDEPVANAPIVLFAGRWLRSVVGIAVSDSGGEWSVGPLAAGPGGYTVIAYDLTGQYDPACKTNLVPSPMPPDPAEHLP